MGKLDRRHIGNIHSLTPIQEGMLFYYLQDPRSPLYFEQLSLELSGEIYRQHFEKAWNIVIEINEMLRTVFRWEKVEKPFQIILKEHACEILFYDLTDLDDARKEDELEKVKVMDREKGFDLARVPFRVLLCKLDEKKYEMIISNHHILYDGWSNGIILKEFFKVYHELCHGQRSIKFPPKPLFKEFVKWIQNRDKNNEEQYWKNYLAGVEMSTELPIKRKIKETNKIEHHSIILEEAIRTRLDSFIKNSHCTLASILYTAWGILLQKYCGLEDVIFGTTVSGRSAVVKGIEDMVGLFINTIPLRIQTNPVEKIKNVVFLIDKVLQARKKFENTSLVDIKSYSGLDSSESLFDSIVVIENYPLDNRLLPEGSLLSVDSYSTIEITHYNLTVSIRPFTHIEIKFSYNADMFEKDAVENLSGHFKCTIRNIIEYPEELLDQFEIISGEEKNRILHEFNDTTNDIANEYAEYKSINQWFEKQIEKAPDKIALISFHHYITHYYITYKVFDKSANYLGWILKNRGVEPNCIVGLMMERSIEMMISIIGILKSGGAYLPIDSDYPPERINYMLKDSNATILINKSKTQHSKFEINPYNSKINIQNKYFKDPMVLDFANPGAEFSLDSKFRISDLNPSDIVYVIYTSGSTGKPKGVAVQKKGFLNLLHWYNEELAIREEDNHLLIAPISFDLAQKNLFSPFLAGGRLILSSPGIPNYPELIDIIYKERITMINCAPSVFYPLIQSNDDIDFTRLHSLRTIVLGGETIHLEKLHPWVDSIRFHCEIINTYGPTECTDIAAFYRIPSQSFHYLKVIPIGKPIPNVNVFILDKYLKILPIRIPGELCIGGICVSKGYYNNIHLTETKFIDTPHLPTKKVYCTGDIARWFPDGNIDFLGRSDDQVKIRGLRIELSEIEGELAKHEKIKGAIITSRQYNNGDNYLCAYILLHEKQEITISRLREYLGQRLPNYMVPAYFVFLDRIPLTPSGKIDRRGLPEPEIKKEKSFVAPRNRIEEELALIWGKILDIRELHTAVIGIDDNFFQLGGHSLKATSLASVIYKKFNVKIPLKEIINAPTIRGLSDYINRAIAEKYIPIEPIEEKEYYTLSSAQKRLFFLQQMDNAGIAYNISAAWTLKGIIDETKLEQSFAKLIQRHESLRTSIVIIKEEPVQQVYKQAAFEIEKLREPGEQGKEKKIIKNFFRPFDLSRAPLLRVGLLRTGEKEYILVFDMHHIISDGVSMGILVKEFIDYYSLEVLPELQFHYKDFSHWHNNLQPSEKMKEQEMFWHKQFEGEIPVLTLTTDYPRPSVQKFTGNRINFEIGPTETGNLRQLALETRSTFYMVLFALFSLFLSRLSGQEDIVVGTITAGRRRHELENIIGMFVNTLAIRTDIPGGKLFLDFLTGIKENILAAFENQDYQYENLVEQIVQNRDLSRNPLFDVMFVLQNIEMPRLELPALTLEPCECQTGSSKFDFTFCCEEKENQLMLYIEYGTHLFKKETIERFIRYFKQLVESVLENVDRCLFEIEIISETEKYTLLNDINRTEAVYPANKTIQGLFEDQVLDTPDRIALHNMACLLPGVPPLILSLSYRELNGNSSQLAARLKEKGVTPGSIVGIMVERSIEMVTAILGILKADCAYLPADPGYPQERITYMLKDSSAILLLTANEIASLASECVSNSHYSSFSIYPTNHLAYVIYTSGSTGKPKGVMVCHRNVVRLVKNNNFVPLNRETRILQTGAPVFDAATFEIWGSLLNGGQLVVTDKNTLLDAHGLAMVLQKNQINTLWLSSSLFNQLMQEDVELFSPLHYLLVGGDILSVININRLKRRFPGLNIINGYGPTENTTFSTTYLIKKKFKHSIPIGRPIANSTAYIYDKNHRLVPVGVVGELFVGGDGIALGYLNNPELTGEKFIHFNHPSFINHHSKLYRTGDLARWFPDPSERGDYIIEFLGRIDYQVKIRGFRVELSEIESQLLISGKIREAAVIAVEGKQADKILAAYIVFNSEIPATLTEIKEYLQKVLPAYMVPSHFVKMEKIPLTTNGKVDRKLLPKAEINKRDAYMAPRNEIEKKLVDIWAGILGLSVEAIGIEDNFFQLGGHSLKAMRMASRIQKEFKLKLPLVEIFKRPSVRGLAEFIKIINTGEFIPIEVAPHRDYYILSASQRRMYLLNRMDESSTAYNISSVLLLEGTLDISRFEEVLRKLIKRHESFRTSFQMMTEEAVQIIHAEVEFEIEYKDLTADTADEHEQTRVFLKVFGPTFFQKGGPPEAIIKSFIRSFDLSRAPLLRVGLFKQENTYLLILDMHHIISDGMSIDIFVREFMALYEGKELPGIKLQYKDYAEWQQSLNVRKILMNQETYWLEQFAGEIPVLNLPLDYTRPKVQSFAGRFLAFEIGSNETTQLKKLALEQGTTLYIILLAAFGIFLSKISGQEDIVIGTPTAGRRMGDLEPIIGMFVNTLALRHSTHGEKNFAEFLGEITGRTFEAFENQDYPFEDLVGNVVKERDMGRNPLFDVMFVLQNMEISEIVIPGLKLSAYPYERNTAKFDITLTGIESGEGLHFDFEYCSKLFEETTIQRFIGFFKKIISEILPAVRKPNKKLAEFEIISEEERKQILVEFNDTYREYPVYTGIQLLFKEQVQKIPDTVALVSSFHHFMSYKELNAKSDLLGWVLKNKGEGPNCVIALMVERSIEMMIGIWGILKSGGVYLPVDPDYPVERIRFMLEDSESSQWITRSKFLHADFNREVIDIESINSFKYPGIDSEIINDRRDPIYMIYTSGSTGKPKGVMVQKEGFLNLLRWYIDELNIGKEDKNLLIAPISFDLAQKNLFSPFLTGGRLILASPGTPDYRELAGIIYKERITMINCAPSVFYPLIELNDVNDNNNTDFTLLHSLRVLILGGEPIRIDRLQPWMNADDFHCEIINTYGPTECTDIATSYRIPVNSSQLPGVIPIGRPIANVKVYVLDKYLHVLPAKIPGELCIGGIGLSQGYYNNKQLSEEKFAVAPHIPGNRVYRTGDLTRWLTDGNIEFLGRIDQQVKIRGFRIELNEIEAELLKHEDIKEAAVILRERETGDNYLCAYIVPRTEKRSAPSVLREYLKSRLPGYMTPSYFVYLEHMPLTPSGKINRRGFPEPEINMEINYVAPRDQIEARLVSIWRNVLVLEASSVTIGIDDNFFQLGGHSLKAAIMTAKVYNALQVQIPLARVFETPTIRALAKYIKESSEKKYDPIGIAPESEYYELSSAQKRLYILQHIEPNSTGYNMPIAMRLLGELDGGKLEKIFVELIARHESLRTSFETLGERPVQKIHAHVDFKIEYYGAGEINLTGGFNIYGFVNVFNLSKAPLLRIGLIKIDAKEHILMLDMHHIIADGISLTILCKEMMALYQGNALPDLKITYKDYAVWQNHQNHTNLLALQEKYWLEQFAEEIPVLNLPTDYPRPLMKSFEGNRVDFDLGREDTELLKKLAQAQGVTLYMILLAACCIWLSKLSSDEDIVIGTPIAGRIREEFQGIIGMFVNTLPLRNFPKSEKLFAGFLKEVKERALDAFHEQDFQFEDLVERLMGDRDTSRNPVFDVMFVFQNMEKPIIDIPGLTLRPYEYEIKTSKFDLNLVGMDLEDRLSFSLEYCTKLFKEETALRFCEYFKNIINSINENPWRRIADIEIMGKKEKEKILEISNGIDEYVDSNETIHGMFEKIVRSNKDKTALVFGEGRITYGRLNWEAHKLARILQSRGVGRDTIVGLMVERSFDTIIGMLAIMKAGGAYLPIDPMLPAQRKRYMMDDCHIKIVLTNFEIDRTFHIPINVAILDMRNKRLYSDIYLDDEELSNINNGSNLVYVIFTSGSTGKPKGVMLEHINLVNLMYFHLKYTTIDFTKVLQFTTISFDVSFQEIFSTLLAAGSLYLVDEDVKNNISALFEFVGKNKIKTLFLPMAFLKLIFSHDEYIEIFPRSVTHILTAGEQVIVNERLRNYLKKAKIFLHNHYGPSEAHVVTVLTLDHRKVIPGFPAVGKPVMNTGIYILNKDKNLQPMGVAGELYIGGLQVGRGYLNRPELTRRAFGPLITQMTLMKNKNSALQADFHQSTFGIPRIQHSILYCTGDLARWLSNGNVEFLGRIDHQVKIRGVRVEPGEIESCLKKIKFVKDAIVVWQQDVKGEKYLCAYIVLGIGIELEAAKLRNILRESLPDYMVPAYFVPVDKIPLTPSGKLDRRRLPEPDIKKGEGNYTAPRNRIEEDLVKIWSDVLGKDQLHTHQLQATIGIDDNFFELGGHSLKAMILVSKIHKKFDAKVPLTKFFQMPRIRELAEYIKGEAKEYYKPIALAEKKEYYILSSAQKRLYSLQQMNQGSTAYNMPVIIPFPAAYDLERIEGIFKNMIKRHESLRTSFHIVNNTLVQKIQGNVEFKIEYIDLASEIIENTEGNIPFSSSTIHHFIYSFIRPFDLSQAPLLRVNLLKNVDGSHIIMIDIHHIITDGISVNLIKKEFMALYAGEELSPLKLQYKDYSEWQASSQQQNALEKEEKYWLSQFKDGIPILNMPLDFQRPDELKFEGDLLDFEISANQIDRVKNVISEKEVTLNIFLLAVYNVLLSKYTGEDDILVGIVAAGRRHTDLQDIIGFFVNMLPIRNHPKGNKTFDEFLSDVKKNAVAGYENQEYPFEELVSKLGIKRESGRHPLIDTVFVFQEMEEKNQQIDILSKENLIRNPYKISHFDLMFHAAETGDLIKVTIEYSSVLFNKSTISEFSKCYIDILEQVVDRTNIPLAEIKIKHNFVTMEFNFNQEKLDFDF